MSKRYIVITPAKNEERFIGNSIQSVVDQTLKPEYHLIVNDGSTDNTQSIIESYRLHNDWIDSLLLPFSEWDIGIHYSNVCICGFEYAIEHCTKYDIPYDFILLLDADTILEKHYVEMLISEFLNDPDLGIASGCVYHLENNELIMARTRKDLPRGTGRMWRKQCFSESGGYIREVAPDSVSNIKARNRGWMLRQFTHIMEIEQRNTGTGAGIWKGAVKRGYMSYRSYKNPLVVFATFIGDLAKKRDISTLGYAYGYLSSVLRRKEITQDKEIRSYYMIDNFNYLLKLLYHRCR